MPVPQIIVTLRPDGRPAAEMPGLNGSRQKIELDRDWPSRNPEIMAALLESRDRIQKAEQEARDDLKRKVIYGIAKDHGREIANRVINDAWISPSGVRYTNSQWLALKAERDARRAEGRKPTTIKSRKSKSIDLSLALDLGEIDL